MMLTKNGVTIIAGVIALVAAIFWLIATIVRVRVNSKLGADGDIPMTISRDGTDTLETMRAQSSWNRWAALATCFAALAQAVANFMPAE